MVEKERNEAAVHPAGRALPTAERLRPEMTFLAENPEAFGLVPDACPLATKHLLIAANGHGAEGGGGSLVYDLDLSGPEGLMDFYGNLIPHTAETEMALRFAFGENSTLREHPVARYSAALAEVIALQVMNGPSGGADHEHILMMLNQELRRALRGLREKFEELDQVDILPDDVFEPSVCICRIRNEGGGDYVADVFAAGDFRVYMLDEQGMAPLWSTVTPSYSPERSTGLTGRSLRFRHPAPFAVILVSESICALNAVEYRSQRSEPGLIWRYRMRLEDYFLRLVTDCVREYEFEDRATRFFVGRSHGRDSASGAITILRDGVSYETFRLHCQNRLSALGRQMELLPNGYDPHNVPVQEPRVRTELTYLRGLLENSPELSDRVADALRICIAKKFARGEEAPAVPPLEDVPDYRRLNLGEIRKAFRRLDCENDGDRARIAENNAALRESLAEHWITLRPVLVERDDASAHREYRETSDEVYRVCLDMNRRLAEMLERRQKTLRAIQNCMAESLDLADAEGDDWACGRAGMDSLRAWMRPLQKDLPALLRGLETDWQADTEAYRSLLTAYTAERDDLFRRDTQAEQGAFAQAWQGMLEGRLPDSAWEDWRDRLLENPETAYFADFLDALHRISRGTGALLGRIRARAAENRMARELSNHPDLRVAALRGAAYEDADWGEEVIAVMDTATRNEFRATVRRWQETRRLMERQKQAYEDYLAMYTAYEA